MRLQTSYWLLLAAGGLLLPATAAADDPSTEGVVRLGKANASLSSVEGAQASGTEQAGYGCPSGDGVWCPHGVGYCGTCGIYGCHPHCAHLMHALHWLSPYHGGCTVPPDHGFAPPGHHPVPRAAVTYRRWFPGAWTGEPSTADPNFRYPMVYTPTDTTQLGYYYQRVPVWQRMPGMIPPPPRPNEWHVPAVGVRHAGYCGPQGETISGDAADASAAEGDTELGSPAKPAPIDSTSPVPEIKEGGSPAERALPPAGPAPPPPAA